MDSAQGKAAATAGQAEGHTATQTATQADRPRDSGQINVLVKAFNVIEVMAELREPAPLRDIAAASDLPKGTLFRILQTLVTLGYAGQNPENSHYHLTGRLAYLGRNAGHEELKQLVAPHMRQLSERFNETVNLGILEGTQVCYLSVLEARRNLSWKVETGSHDVYYATALGRAIVAHMPPAQRDALLEQTRLQARTAHTVATLDALRAIIDDVAARGVAIDREENDHGVICIGHPVFLDDKVVAAISLSIPATRYSDTLEADIAAALQGLDLRFSRHQQG